MDLVTKRRLVEIGDALCSTVQAANYEDLIHVVHQKATSYHSSPSRKFPYTGTSTASAMVTATSAVGTNPSFGIAEPLVRKLLRTSEPPGNFRDGELWYEVSCGL